MQQTTPPRGRGAACVFRCIFTSLYVHQEIVDTSHFLIVSRLKPGGGGVYIYGVPRQTQDNSWLVDMMITIMHAKTWNEPLTVCPIKPCVVIPNAWIEGVIN